MGEIILLIHFSSTWLMVGVIWFVQLVHYPLFARANREEFVEFARDHQRRTGWVVAPAMLTELLTGIALLAVELPGIPVWEVYLGLGLIMLNVLSTTLVQMPIHTALGEMGYHPERVRRLVVTNWFRTLVWSFRGMLVTVMVRQVMRE